jgi:hypothetical protein
LRPDFCRGGSAALCPYGTGTQWRLTTPDPLAMMTALVEIGYTMCKKDSP